MAIDFYSRTVADRVPVVFGLSANLVCREVCNVPWESRNVWSLVEFVCRGLRNGTGGHVGEVVVQDFPVTIDPRTSQVAHRDEYEVKYVVTKSWCLCSCLCRNSNWSITELDNTRTRYTICPPSSQDAQKFTIKGNNRNFVLTIQRSANESTTWRIRSNDNGPLVATCRKMDAKNADVINAGDGLEHLRPPYALPADTVLKKRKQS